MVERPEGYWKRRYANHREQRIAESTAYQRAHRAERAEYMREYYKANPDKFPKRSPEQRAAYNARRREKYAADAEFRERVKAQSKSGDPEVKRNTRLLRSFGITAAEYDRMLEDQGGKCGICRLDCTSGRRLAVDHCHETGRVRGLLCGNCNHGLGKFLDDPGLLDRAAMYLRTQERD